jgi:ribosomal protein S18 acetylase RimI-like enzyme
MESDEVLESGYGPGAPPGDNLLNDFVQGEAAAFIELARARGELVYEDAEFALALTDGGSPTPFGNVAVLRRPLSDAEWPEAAHRMHAFYGEQAGGPFMTFSGWPTPDVRTLGFGAIGHPPLMVRMPASIIAPDPDGFAIRPVTDAETAEQFEQVMIAGYPVPELEAGARGVIIGTNLDAAPRWLHYVGLLDDRPVATGSAFVDDHHVHVEFIATLPDCRGQGVGAAITAAATRADPTLPALLIASDLGQPVYRRLGYVSVSRFTLWAGHRGHELS